MKNIQLIPTAKLLKEIKSRAEHCVVMVRQDHNEDRSDFFWDFQGDAEVLMGMCDRLKHQIQKENTL